MSEIGVGESSMSDSGWWTLFVGEYTYEVCV